MAAPKPDFVVDISVKEALSKKNNNDFQKSPTHTYKLQYDRRRGNPPPFEILFGESVKRFTARVSGNIHIILGGVQLEEKELNLNSVKTIDTHMRYRPSSPDKTDRSKSLVTQDLVTASRNKKLIKHSKKNDPDAKEETKEDKKKRYPDQVEDTDYSTKENDEKEKSDEKNNLESDRNRGRQSDEDKLSAKRKHNKSFAEVEESGYLIV